jgi:hypothetical protein
MTNIDNVATRRRRASANKKKGRVAWIADYFDPDGKRNPELPAERRPATLASGVARGDRREGAYEGVAAIRKQIRIRFKFAD